VGKGVVEARLGDLVAVGARVRRRRVRLRVERLADTRPSSARTRSVSSRLVGSTTRAITRSRKTSSSTTSNPRLEYTSARTSYTGPEEVLSTRGRGTSCREDGVAVALANSPACVAGATIVAFGIGGVIPRSRTPCWSSASSRCASSIRSPSSASSRAEPTWRTIRRRPATDSAICTAVAPEAVRTLRTQATSRSYRPGLVPWRRTNDPHRRRSERSGPRNSVQVTQLRPEGAARGIDSEPSEPLPDTNPASPADAAGSWTVHGCWLARTRRARPTRSLRPVSTAASRSPSDSPWTHGSNGSSTRSRMRAGIRRSRPTTGMATTSATEPGWPRQ